MFSFDPDDPTTASASGLFVAHCRAITKSTELSRITDTQHTSVHVADGTNFPIQIRTTVVFFADGGVEVKVDILKCEGEFGA